MVEDLMRLPISTRRVECLSEDGRMPWNEMRQAASPPPILARGRKISAQSPRALRSMFRVCGNSTQNLLTSNVLVGGRSCPWCVEARTIEAGARSGDYHWPVQEIFRPGWTDSNLCWLKCHAPNGEYLKSGTLAFFNFHHVRNIATLMGYRSNAMIQ